MNEGFGSRGIVQPEDDCDESERIDSVSGFKDHQYSQRLEFAFYFLTFGFGFIIFRWYPSLRLRLLMHPCPLSMAHYVIVKQGDGIEVVCTVIYLSEQPGVSHLLSSDSDVSGLRLINHRCKRYMYDPSSLAFRKVEFNINIECEKIHTQHGKGVLDPNDYHERLAYYGANLVSVPLKSDVGLLLDEVLHPFFVFQLFSITLWLLEQYFIYAVTIFVVSFGSAVHSLGQTKANILDLKRLAEYECTVTVRRYHRKSRVLSSSLVPGDVVEVEQDMRLPCDGILVEGGCIMNESSLTGESVPVFKSSLPSGNAEGAAANYDEEKDKKHTLFAGTHVLQPKPSVDGNVYLLVSRTGYSTANGKLVSSILFPKPTTFKFYQDSFKFIGVLFIIASFGFMYSFIHLLSMNMSFWLVLIRAGDLVTIIVPPALPVAMTVGTTFALKRLNAQKIFCIRPSCINVSGKINVMCFDKTGTLTEDGLDVFGVLPTVDSRFLPFGQDISGSPQAMLEILAACHSIAVVNRRLIGDPLELRMVEATGWTLHEPPPSVKHGFLVPAIMCAKNTTPLDCDTFLDPISAQAGPSLSTPMLEDTSLSDITSTVGDVDNQCAVLHRYEFTSGLQRMSVLVKPRNEKGVVALIKGAPEKIRDLCLPGSVPQDFQERLEEYTRHGYRVIACARKSLPHVRLEMIPRLLRSEVEKDGVFCGLLVLENKLKPSTSGVITTLARANIRSIMVTGDNVLTAISVGRTSKILPQDLPIYLGEISLANTGSQFVEDRNEEVSDISTIRRHQPTESVYEVKWTNIDYPFVILNPNTLTPEIRPGVEMASHAIPTDYLTKPFEFAITGHVFDALYAKHLADSKARKEREEAAWRKLYDPSPASRDLEMESIETPQSPFTPAVALHSNSTFKSMQYPRMSLEWLLDRCRVFARMTPDNKAELVESYNEMGYYTGFCGDGANDCGALKAAQAGISLSEAEASIAAPLTSQVATIDCVVTVIREGRAALSTSFQSFKFMAMYSLIQFMTVLQMYTLGITLADMQFLFIDLFLVLPLAVSMGRTGPYHRLSTKQPPGTLISRPVLLSLIGHALIQGLLQFSAHHLVKQQDFFSGLSSFACDLVSVELFAPKVTFKPESGPPKKITNCPGLHFELFYLFFLPSLFLDIKLT
eukprot:TRINITY_DN6796_c0_g1_i7.p1 TRINITY_DN6796_c0_g1~~TRINITY_DN6796_c0_g1_i7.p1  ORF type:complete len:1160 (+),score=178.83 TRINITY_DN6796_c0_g1_i7:67-3546(+)